MWPVKSGYERLQDLLAKRKPRHLVSRALLEQVVAEMDTAARQVLLLEKPARHAFDCGRLQGDSEGYERGLAHGRGLAG